MTRKLSKSALKTTFFDICQLLPEPSLRQKNLPLAADPSCSPRPQPLVPDLPAAGPGSQSSVPIFQRLIPSPGPTFHSARPSNSKAGCREETSLPNDYRKWYAMLRGGFHFILVARISLPSIPASVPSIVSRGIFLLVVTQPHLLFPSLTYPFPQLPASIPFPPSRLILTPTRSDSRLILLVYPHIGRPNLPWLPASRADKNRWFGQRFGQRLGQILACAHFIFCT